MGRFHTQRRFCGLSVVVAVVCRRCVYVCVCVSALCLCVCMYVCKCCLDRQTHKHEPYRTKLQWNGLAAAASRRSASRRHATHATHALCPSVRLSVRRPLCML